MVTRFLVILAGLTLVVGGLLGVVIGFSLALNAGNYWVCGGIIFGLMIVMAGLIVSAE